LETQKSWSSARVDNSDEDDDDNDDDNDDDDDLSM
jgi:hypothetical protein